LLSQVTDEEGADWKELVKEGQQVKAVIMDVNLESKKVSLGLKRSLFPEDYEGSSDGEDLSEDEDDEEEEGEDDDEMEGEGEGADSDEGEEIDLSALLKAQGADDDSDVEMDGEDDDVEPSVRYKSL